MRDPHDIIKRPQLTEKGSVLSDKVNQYAFEVALDANKIEIKNAVEKLFKVKVVKVRTANVLGKTRRVGRSLGSRPNWKKAYVTLGEGQRIDFFEQV